MYWHLGRDYVLNTRDIIGIFNLETTTISPRGRAFLEYAQKNGAVVSLSDELRCFCRSCPAPRCAAAPNSPCPAPSRPNGEKRRFYLKERRICDKIDI